MTLWSTFGVGALFCVTIMTLAWWLSVRLNFYSLVDAFWAYGIGAVTLLYAALLDGDLHKKSLAVGLAACWSLRLGSHLALRLRSHFPQEDVRYVELKKKWGQKQFLFFFLFQGISQSLFSLPFLFLCSDLNSSISQVVVFGSVIFLIGFLGESLADKQLSQFRNKPENKGLVCNIGLWKYSRHPNYFFEWIIWCGSAIAALTSPFGYMGLLSPVLMFLTLNYFTGVPAAEAQSLKSKGDLYKNYQAKTNRFFPGP